MSKSSIDDNRNGVISERELTSCEVDSPFEAACRYKTEIEG